MLAKRAVLGDHLVTQCVPPAYLVAYEVRCIINFSVDAGEQLEPNTIVEIIEFNALPRRKATDSGRITNVM
jgi:hypothetical protein